MRFPRIAARDLEGGAVALPAGFEGARNVVIVAFRRPQQSLVDSWASWLEERAAHNPALRFYELPTIGLRWSPARSMIDGGMAAAIHDRDVRRRTLTVYTDVRRVTSALDLTRVDTIAIFVVERDGTVLWRGEGGFDPQTAASLARALDERMGSAPDAATRVEQFEFAFDARFRPLLAVLGVTPSTAHITVTTDRLVARFGPWSCDTAIANVVCAGLTGPHAWYKAIGARGSFADRGLTFGTNTRLGVCLEFREAVRGLMPFGLFRHPGLTLTLADRERFVTLVRQRAGLDNAVSAGKPTRS